MPRLSKQQVIQVCRDAGFPSQYVAMAASIAWAESEGLTDARNINPSPYTIDRGLFQINNYWHPEVSDACADSPSCAAKAALRISEGGKNWSQWTTFTNRRYQEFLPEMQRLAGTSSTPTPGGAVPTGNYVTLYDQPNFRGASQRITGDVDDARKYPVPGRERWYLWNTKIRSIALPPNTILTIYSNVYYNKGGDGRAPIWVVDRSLPDVTAFNNGLGPSSWVFGNRTNLGPGKIEDRRGQGVIGSPGSGSGGGTRPAITASGGFLRLAQQIASAEYIASDVQPNATIELSIGTIDLSIVGGEAIELGGTYEVPGTGYAKTALYALPGLAVRAAIVGAGLWILSKGITS